MGEICVAGLFIALAVLIVLSGPARLLRAARAVLTLLRGLRRGERRGPEAAAGE